MLSKKYLLITCFLLGFILLVSCSKNNQEEASKILGPKDQPKFKTMKWKEIKITYWIQPKKDRKQKRSFVIKEEETIDKIKESMAISKVSPSSLGAGTQIVITLDDGDKWQGDIVFAERLDLCKTADKYYSYIIEFSDTAFFGLIKRLSLDEEIKHNKTATSRHIILRSNKSLSDYEILSE